MNTVVEQFLKAYRREFDYHQEAARICAQLCETELLGAGKRAIVTYRAKSPDRLAEKCNRRQEEEGKSYNTSDDIANDIIDLSGVRIALYFPSDQQYVDKVIRSLFRLIRDPKSYPDGRRMKYKKQFDGYHAVHYLIGLKPDRLGSDQQRYLETRIEIQVASVLMHAWAEVEHDLAYKPLSGDLSDGEYAILDELNGLVLTGEIALRRLQVAFDQRVNEANKPFTNHFELAAFLYRELRLARADDDEPGIGRVDLLFQLLLHYDKNCPATVKPLLATVITDPEHDRPISDQVIDLFIGKDKERYGVFEDIRAQDTRGLTYGDAETLRDARAIGTFLNAWIGLEKVIRQLVGKQPGWWHGLSRQSGIQADLVAEINQLRSMRNMIVHGIAIPTPAELAATTVRIKAASKELNAFNASRKRRSR
jgi:ppGpp synthetase/RelA/SpoT-type nucleotidyltranferase